MKKQIEKIILNDSLYSIYDENGNTTFVSQKLYELLGDNEDFCEFKAIKKYVNLKNIIQLKKDWSGIIQTRDSYGKSLYLNCKAYHLENSPKETLLVLKYNITEFMNGSHLARADMITRKHILNYIHNLDRDKIYLAAFINIDDFSYINSLYGEFFGDQVLSALFSRLQEIENYICFTMGGDEFLLIDESIVQKNNISIKIQKLKKEIAYVLSSDIVISETKVHLRASAGIATSEPLLLLEKTKQALKEARFQNRKFKTIVDFDLQIEEKKEELRRIEKLNAGIKNKTIDIHFQPIINNNTMEIDKYEALVRIKTEDGFMQPGEFLDLAKKTKVYNKITKEVLRKSYEELTKNQAIKISMNISMEDILNPNTKNAILKKIKKTDVSINQRMTFEIVETIDIHDYDIFNSFSKSVRKYGIKIAIDDFGVGFSNFSHLSNIEFDYLKIDGTFIKNIFLDRNIAIVESIVAFCKKNKIKVVAEYVENEMVFKKLCEIGVDFSQGYYFGKPMASIENERDR